MPVVATSACSAHKNTPSSTTETSPPSGGGGGGGRGGGGQIIQSLRYSKTAYHMHLGPSHSTQRREHYEIEIIIFG